MKKTTILLIFILQAILIYAKSPELPLYRAFDGRYNKEKGVTISEISQSGNYYYSIHVNNNENIARQLIQWAEASKKFSNSISTSISNGNYNIIFQVPFDETEINVGIKYPDDKSFVNVFMQSDKPFLDKN